MTIIIGLLVFAAGVVFGIVTVCFCTMAAGSKIEQEEEAQRWYESQRP